MNIERMIESNPDVSVAIVDTSGNALIKYKNGLVELKLMTEAKSRKVGIIKDGILFIERSSKKHIHRKSNSYGFNYYLLKKGSSFNKVALIEDDETTYLINKDTILQYGKCMNFKNAADGNSFELQIFLNRDIIKKYKTVQPKSE